LNINKGKAFVPSGRCIQGLDYTHRNEDGSVGVVPDSLISKFSTKKGRIVYDGGGVSPDLPVDDKDLSNLSINLVTQSKIFDYATIFNNKTEKIAQPEEFTISPEIYADFVQYLKGQSFNYESKTEKELDQLIDVAKKEKYYDLAKSELDQLRSTLGHNLDQDLEHFKPEVSELLTDEIVSRYYFQKGAIKSSLRDDQDLKKALELINKPEAYAAIFDKGRVIKAN